MNDDRNSSAWGRRRIAQAVTEGTLDGVLAAFVLSRYQNEARDEIVPIVSRSIQNGDFSRDRTAILAVSLERHWVPISEALAQRFVQHFQRLEDQAGHPENDPTTSPRLLWLASRGALVDAVRSCDSALPERLGNLLDWLRVNGPSLRDRLVGTAALGDLQVEERAGLAERACRDILGCADAILTPEDALAAVWFGTVVHAGWNLDQREPQALVGLLPELRRRALEYEDSGDAITALMADGIAFMDDRAKPVALDIRAVILTAFETFSEVARRLQDRLHARPAFAIENEYDVQDLLYVMLKTPIPDLVDEEPTPKSAGTSKHIDFITRQGRSGIEVKFVRDARHGKEVADEIRQDLDHYPEHPDCDSVFVFVFDPKRCVRDAGVFQSSLSGVRNIKGHEVMVEVRVKPR